VQAGGESVRWNACVRYLLAEDVREVKDIGPGTVVHNW